MAPKKNKSEHSDEQISTGEAPEHLDGVESWHNQKLTGTERDLIKSYIEEKRQEGTLKFGDF